MKKKSLKNLKLGKRSISNFSSISGGGPTFSDCTSATYLCTKSCLCTFLCPSGGEITCLPPGLPEIEDS